MLGYRKFLHLSKEKAHGLVSAISLYVFEAAMSDAGIAIPPQRLTAQGTDRTTAEFRLRQDRLQAMNKIPIPFYRTVSQSFVDV
jgi:hypothetical protein